MPTPLQLQIEALDLDVAERTGPLVDLILNEAVRCAASDVHFEPTRQQLEIRFRLDGALHCMASLSRGIAPNVVARLKVLSELLTYRQDIPQEGRLVEAPSRYGMDVRVSTFPTIHGEKVAVRLFHASSALMDLEQIGLPEILLRDLQHLLQQRTGAIFLTGPGGSGKTTTLYACLRYLRCESGKGRQIVTMEDPVEQVLDGITQAQTQPGAVFDFACGLRSLLRQDPEIIMVGEVRDPETAHITMEAALTGHLVLSTLHAGSACGVLSRLLEMGIEPHLLASALKGILNQRLVRRLCQNCRRLDESAWTASGCEHCMGTGYQGRILLAELVLLDAPLRQAVLARADTDTLEQSSTHSGQGTIWKSADNAVAMGWTQPHEILRVLGPRPMST